MIQIFMTEQFFVKFALNIYYHKLSAIIVKVQEL